jgi:hypothetical protein
VRATDRNPKAAEQEDNSELSRLFRVALLSGWKELCVIKGFLLAPIEVHRVLVKHPNPAIVRLD